MEIIPVEDKRGLMKFIRFPWKIYKNDKNWVPQLISDTKTTLDVNKNPFWKHAEQKFFLCVDNGEIIGRVAGVIDRNYIKFQNDKCGFFAFFECVNDKNAACLLIGAVRDWLKENDIHKMLGPTAPSTNDEMGLLLEGYDGSPVLMMPYNPEYYHKLLLFCGLKKAKDLYAFHLDAADLPMDKLNTIAKGIIRRVPDLTVRGLDVKDFENEIERARQVYNSAWEKNWGFVPWTDEEFHWQCDKLKPLVVADLVMLAQVKDEPIGILIAVPDYNRVLKKLNGKLGPVQLLKFLWYRRKLHSLRIMIMGVKKEYRLKGIEGFLYYNVQKNARRLGYDEGEMSWILEDNQMMCRSAEMLGGKVYRKYRVYQS